MFFSELSFTVEWYCKFFSFSDITGLAKREKKNFRIQRLVLQSCQDVPVMLEAVLYFFTPAVMAICKVKHFAP